MLKPGSNESKFRIQRNLKDFASVHRIINRNIAAMPKFLIEVPHNGDRFSCQRKLRIFKASGSHFVTHAEWGCSDGDHKAWMIVEIESKEAALKILPYIYRTRAKVTQIMRFNLRDLQMSNPEYHS